MLIVNRVVATERVLVERVVVGALFNVVFLFLFIFYFEYVKTVCGNGMWKQYEREGKNWYKKYCSFLIEIMIKNNDKIHAGVIFSSLLCFTVNKLITLILFIKWLVADNIFIL